MTWADFEEKEYETAIGIELAQGALGAVFSSGQVLEAVVGYDSVASIDRDNAIWRILRVPRPPGIHLAPAMWLPGRKPPASRLPEIPISLVLQYKRPEYLSGARAKQWHFWHCPYYRFTRTQRQQRVLLRLSRRLGAAAVVRYAAPAFHMRSELEANHIRRQVAANSGFVDPVVLTGHSVWTYVEPGTKGMANANGRLGEFEMVETLRILLQTVEPDARNLPANIGAGWFEHIMLVGAAAMQREPDLQRKLAIWRSTLERSDIPLEERSVDALHAVAAITSLMARDKGVWFLGGLEA